MLGSVVLLAAIAASTAVAVLNVSAQTGLTIGFADSTGQPTNHVVLPDIDDSDLVQVHFSGPIDPAVNVAQIWIIHDPAEVEVTAPAGPTPLCDGAFANAFSGTGRIGDATWFLCGITGSVETPADGLVLNLLVTRKAVGEPTLEFRIDGDFATELFAPGTTPQEPVITYGFDSASTLAVVVTAPPATPTPVPSTPTPTATPVQGGGGGGGGGGFAPPPPEPTATPAGPVLEAPGAPRNVTATAIDGGVELSWDAPAADGGAEIENYRVLIIPTGQAILIPALQTSTTITGLDPAISYQFQVNAVNSVGAGTPADLTPPVSPLNLPGAPQSVAAFVGSDNTSATVLWQAPEGAFTGYTVVSNPPIGNGVQAAAGATSVVFPGLAFNTSYTFRVRAESEAGPGPLSAPSNLITTGGPGSSSPGDAPGSSVTPSVEASEQDIEQFETAVSSAFGSQITLNSGQPTVTSAAGRVLVEFPAETGGAGSTATGSISSKVGNLTLDISGGTGTAKLVIDEQISITGSARLETDSNGVQVQIEGPTLTFMPEPPQSFSGGGGLVTQVGADFGVGLSNLPDSIGLDARFISDPEEAPEALLVFGLAAAFIGGDIEDTTTDIAFMVTVDKTGVTNNDLGDNKVTLTVSRAWYDARLAQGKQIYLTKVGDDDVAHTFPASCQVDGDVVHCSAVFAGAAGGFSIFGVTAVTPNTSGNTGQPTPTTVAATATPTPAPTSTPAVSPTATATTTPPVATEIPPTPTPTVLSALQPSPVAPDDVEPDLPENDGGGFPWWASLLIALGALAVLAPAARVVYSAYASRRPG